jgi:hypothetical protein
MQRTLNHKALVPECNDSQVKDMLATMDESSNIQGSIHASRPTDDQPSFLTLLESVLAELPPGLEVVTFTFAWDLVSFLEQQYDDGVEQDLRHIITWTEQGGNVQVTTCEQYTKQQWSQTGTTILSALGSAVATQSKEKTTCKIIKGDNSRSLY